MEPPYLWVPPVYHEATGVLCWPIRKNASQSVSMWMEAAGAVRLDPRQPLPEEARVSFVMLRDPVERYISSMWQVWVQGYVTRIEWAALVEGTARYNRDKGRPWDCKRDEHFTRQSETIDRARDPVRFPMDFPAVRAWAAGHGLELAEGPPHAHRGPTPEDRALAREALDHEIIRGHYHRDVMEWEALGGPVHI